MNSTGKYTVLVVLLKNSASPNIIVNHFHCPEKIIYYKSFCTPCLASYFQP